MIKEPNLPEHLLPVLEQLERKGTVRLVRFEGEIIGVDDLDVDQLRADVARRRREAMTEDHRPLTWKGKDIGTLGPLFDTILTISKIEDEAERNRERDEFLELYLGHIEASPSATTRSMSASEVMASNIGYLSGYAGSEDANRIREVFDVSHPIFGRRTPTPDEALAAGKAWGEAAKRDAE